VSRGLTLCTSSVRSLVHCVFHFNTIVRWRRRPHSSTWYVVHSYISHADVIHRQFPPPITNIIPCYRRTVSRDRDVTYARSGIRFFIRLGFLFARSNTGVGCTRRVFVSYIMRLRKYYMLEYPSFCIKLRSIASFCDCEIEDLGNIIQINCARVSVYIINISTS